MFCRKPAALLALILSLTACARKERISGGPVSVAPFENLSSDPGLDWAGRAVASILRLQLTGTNWVPLDSTSMEAQRAPQTVSGYLIERNGQLTLKAVVRNANAQTVETQDIQGTLGNGLLPLVNELARRFSPEARPFTTSNETAVRELFLATSFNQPDEVLAHLNASLAADPGFSSAYLAKIEILERLGRKDDAKATVEEARKHAGKFPSRDKAQIELAYANLTGNQQQRTNSLEQLVKENPRDVAAAQNLAQSCMQARRFDCAVQALNGALKVEPNNIQLWNSLAYASADAGDLAGAQRAVEQYRKLSPNDANAWDSAGEIHVLAGQYAQAEQDFLEAHKRNPGMLQGGHLYRAALAHALTKDIPGADAIFQKYLELRKQANDPALDLRTAIWQYQTGRADQALATLNTAIQNKSQFAAFALAQSALFLLDMGKREAAREKATESGKQAGQNPAARTLSTIAQILAAPSASAAEWKTRIDSVLKNQQRAHDEILGYALAFDGKYAESIPVWKSLYDSTAPESAGESKSMLALAYAKTGKQAEAAALLKTGIFLSRNPEPGVEVLVFPRFRRLLQ